MVSVATSGSDEARPNSDALEEAALEDLREDAREDLPKEGRGGQMLSRPAARRMAHDGRLHADSPVESA
jgi:hypothetical protein